MGLETGTYLDALVPTNPASTDGLAQADDHIRLIKSTIKNTFPNLTGPVTATQANLNSTTSIPSTLTDLGITDGTIDQVLKTDGSGNFSFFTLPEGATDTNYYVTGGSVSGTTLTLNREGLGSVSISGLPAVTNTSQLTNDSGFITSQYTQPTSVGAVGTYAFLVRNSNTASISEGQSISGSSLVYGSVDAVNPYIYETLVYGNSGTSPSGTWRAMGKTTSGLATKGTVYLRIS